MSEEDSARHSGARLGRIRPSVVAVTCFLRSLPLFVRASPRTPLRVLGLIAFDTLHVLRHSKPLPRRRINELALLLDFQACANAAWDRKEMSDTNCQVLRRRVEEAGLGSWVDEYLSRVGDLESQRPPIGPDHRRFAAVRSYREAVVRLSLATGVGIALHYDCLEQSIRATYCDNDVAALFRIVMQCQIVDDVVDYGEDQFAGLPSFLTALPSLPHARALTARAARDYGSLGEPDRGVFPLRVALRVCTAVATLAIRVRPAA